MSITYSTYVGPYARCAVERVPTEQLRIACLKCGSEYLSMQGAFCSKCGGAIGTVPHTELDFTIDHWDVSEEIDEALCGPGGDEYHRWTERESAHLWLPNHSMPGRDPHLEEREDFALFEITQEQREAEIALFQATFTDALAHLSERYGNLSLHWGVIQSYS